MKLVVLLVIGIGLLALVGLLIYAGIKMWLKVKAKPGSIAWRVGVSLLIVAGIILGINDSVGVFGRVGADTTPRTVVLEKQDGAPNNLLIIAHGYNGHGGELARVLSSLTKYGAVAGFEPGPHGYDNDEVIESANRLIVNRQPDHLFFYGESFGGMVIADLLRAHPELHPTGIVLGASPSDASEVEQPVDGWGPFWQALVGPITTEVLQYRQAEDVKKSASPEPGTNLEAMRAAEQASLKITSPTGADEVFYIDYFDPPKPNEFKGRAGKVIYLHAPANTDGFVKVKQASGNWQQAFGNQGFEDRVAHSWVANGYPLHVPTPERPSPVIGAITDLMLAA